ncbi:hypothetical protein [Teichococcus vastitatis]|uniref:Uncharacterized protein n=1 Tax=Teichococcus vastitatis TaxID=2307076 RepID=A0ABS9WAE2_9PROT|nr:hypothetical protein [Pseudoroseomonas vastitatis]MCI0755559.1 hypothetical protein [Pseudoroseomonas vastitatis]
MSKLPSLKKQASAEDMNLLAGDDRRNQGKALAAVSDAGRDIVADIFSGLRVSEDTLRKVVEARTRILDQWGKAQVAALLIGRTLLDLSRTLSPDEYLALRKDSERLFPFSDSVATKLRRAAELAEDLRIPLERSPSYTLLYEISTMPPEGQDLIKERGLLRADVTRAEIVAVKAELRKHKIPRLLIEHASEPTATVSLVEIETRRNALLRERESVAAQLAELDQEIADLNAQLEVLRPKDVRGS